MTESIPNASGVANSAYQSNICKVENGPKCPKIGSGAFLRPFTSLSFADRIVCFLRSILFSTSSLGVAENRVGSITLGGRGSYSRSRDYVQSEPHSFATVIRINKDVC